MPIKYRLLIGCFVCTLSLSAQGKKWNLQECMQYAVENSLRTVRQDVQNSIYQENYREAIARLLPSVSGGVGTSFQFGRGLDGETNSYVDVNSFSNNYSLESSLTLFGGFSNINRIRIQKVNRLVGAHQLQEIRDMVAYGTMEVFYNVLYYKELVKLAREQLNRSRESLLQVERMEQLGLKSFPDVAEIRAKEAADHFNVTRQSNLEKIETIRLKEQMNFPLDSVLEIEEVVRDTPVAKRPETVREIYEQSQAFLPKLLAADAILRSQELSHTAAKGALYPSISAYAGLSTNFFRYMDGLEYLPFRDQFRDKRGAYVGINLSIPLFQNLSRSSNARRSKYQLEIAEADRDETRRSAYSEIEQAVADLNGQADEYFAAQKQTEFAQMAHRVNIRKYSEDLISLLELHTSETRLYLAQVEELNALLRYRLKSRLVDYYQGAPFIPASGTGENN